MNLAFASIGLVAQLLMQDMSDHVDGKDNLLNSTARNIIDTWLDWAMSDPISEKELDVIMNEVHEGLQFMNIWDYEEKDTYKKKITEYFSKNYSNVEYANKFCKLVLDYYTEEFKYN